LLKVLEEVGIQPDYITGASMGSIVGGLYALGLNAAELEKMAVEQEWELILSNQIEQQVSLALAKLACAGHFIDDFDDFPIPFKCVAVNVINGEVVTLDTGFLGHAQRASMAIPSVFTPVEYGEQLLVDGGVIRNLPVQEVIDMGAEQNYVIIILIYQEALGPLILTKYKPLLTKENKLQGSILKNLKLWLIN